MDGLEDAKVSRRARRRAFKNAAAVTRSRVRQQFAAREVVGVHRFGRVGAFENKVARRRAANKAAGRARKAAR